MIYKIQPFLSLFEFILRKFKAFRILGEFPVKIIEQTVGIQELAVQLRPCLIELRRILEGADRPA